MLSSCSYKMAVVCIPTHPNLYIEEAAMISQNSYPNPWKTKNKSWLHLASVEIRFFDSSDAFYSTRLKHNKEANTFFFDCLNTENEVSAFPRNAENKTPSDTASWTKRLELFFFSLPDSPNRTHVDSFLILLCHTQTHAHPVGLL